MCFIFKRHSQKLLLYCFLFVVLSCPKYSFAADNVSRNPVHDADLRRELFIIERQLSRESHGITLRDQLARVARSENHGGNISDISKRVPFVPVNTGNNNSANGIQGANSANLFATSTLGSGQSNTTGNNQTGNQNNNSQAGSTKQTSFGSVSLKIGSGKLTSYSYSSTGLDLSSLTPGYGIKFLLKEKDDSAGTTGSDTGLANNYSQSMNSFYGMQNYEQFKDMLTPEQKSKDYLFTGFGMNTDLGGYSISMANFSRPPTKKQNIFFGSGSLGPYAVGETNIMPGSVSVKVDGNSQTEQTNYTVDYIKGEITFTAPILPSSRVVVQYDVPENGVAAGKFTGFRIEKTLVKDANKNAGGINGLNTNGTAANGIQGNGMNAASGIAGGTSGSGFAVGAGSNKNVLNKSLTGANAGSPAATGSAYISETSPTNSSLGGDKWYRIRPQAYGISYFDDEVVTFRPPDTASGTATQIESSRTLMGLDGAFGAGRFSTMTFEFARSGSDRRRDEGRITQQSFKITDSKASDGGPNGPYQLDPTKLPAIQNTDEVRIAGRVLERDKDYSLDIRYGYLTLKKPDLNLTPLDAIEVTWRYLTNADTNSAADDSVSDAAYNMEFKNKIGRIEHTMTRSVSGPNFIRPGGGDFSNELGSTAQTIAMPLGKSLKIAAQKSESQTLQDYATDWRLATSKQGFSADYSGKKKFKASYRTDGEQRGDERGSRDANHSASRKISYSFGKKANLDYELSTVRSAQERTTGDSGNDSRNASWRFSVKPVKSLSVDLNSTRGSERSDVSSSSNTASRKSDGMKVHWDAGHGLSLNYDGQTNGFENTLISSVLDPAATSVVPTTSSASSTANANRSNRWTLNWRANSKLSANMTKETKREIFADSPGTTDQTQWDAKYTPTKTIDLQFRTGFMTTIKTNNTMRITTNSLSATLHPGGATSTTQIGAQYDGQRSLMGSDSSGVNVSTRTGGDGLTFNLTTEPFKKGNKWTLERTERKDRNLSQTTFDPPAGSGNNASIANTGDPTNTNDPSNTNTSAFTPQAPPPTFSLDRERTIKLKTAIPVYKKSALNAEIGRTIRSGSRSGGERSAALSLDLPLFKKVKFTTSYRKSAVTDALNPGSSTKSNELLMKLDGKLEWR